MGLHFLDLALWAAAPILNAALLCVLLLRRRVRTFPALAGWCTFTIASAAALFSIYRWKPGSYAIAYWIVDGVDFLFQIAVVAEVARIVFLPLATPLRKSSFWLRSLIACSLLSLLIVWLIRPVASTPAGLWEIRGDLFTSLLISGMFTLVLFASQKLGLHWRSHVMSVGYGLAVWAVAGLVIGLLHGYWGRSTHYRDVEHLRIFVYLCILVYWIVALWRNEPEKGPPPPEIRDAILHVTDKVSYDLAQVLGTREKELH
jgi:hypothetical protein